MKVPGSVSSGGCHGMHVLPCCKISLHVRLTVTVGGRTSPELV